MLRHASLVRSFRKFSPPRPALADQCVGLGSARHYSQDTGAANTNTAIPRRFYRRVSVDEQSGKWRVLLDGKELKTPKGKTLALPTENLANIIAVEWDSQERRLRPLSMPIMTLATTSLDQIPDIRDTLTDTMIRIMETDVACVRAEKPAKLVALQSEKWDPLLEWVKDDLNVQLNTSSGIVYTPHPETAAKDMREYLTTVDDWNFAGLDAVAGCSKSFIHALALFRGKLSPEEMISSARLDELFQIEEWGEVEGGHDIDEADLRMRVNAASLFWSLLRES